MAPAMASALGSAPVSHEKRQLILRMLDTGLPVWQVARVGMLPQERVLEIHEAEQLRLAQPAPVRAAGAVAAGARPRVRPASAPAGGRRGPYGRLAANVAEQRQLQLSQLQSREERPPTADAAEPPALPAQARSSAPALQVPTPPAVQRPPGPQRPCAARGFGAKVVRLQVREGVDDTPSCGQGADPEEQSPSDAADGAPQADDPIWEDEAPSPKEDTGQHGPASQGMSPQEEAAAKTLDRIREVVYRRRVRIRDFFRGFDPLNCGRCTRGQFQKAVSNIVHPMALNNPDCPLDVEALMELFIPKGMEIQEPQVVDFGSFCLAVDEAFNVFRLETAPNFRVPPPGMVVADSYGFDPRPVAEMGRLQSAMEQIAETCRLRSIDLPACFVDIQRPQADRACGKIRPEEFVRCCPLATSTPAHPAVLDRDDVELVLARYTDECGFFRLFPFLQDMQEVLDGEPPWSMDAMRRPPAAQETSRGFPLAPPPDRFRLMQQPWRRPQSARPAGATSRPFEATARPQSARISSMHGRSMPPAGDPSSDRAEQRTVEAKAETNTMEWTLINGLPIPIRRKTPPGEVLPRLRRMVRELCLVDIFKAFRVEDPMRFGYLPLTKARAAMSVLKLSVDGEDWDALIDIYGTEDGFFCYPDFCADIQVGPTVTAGGEELQPSAAGVAVGAGMSAARAQALSSAAAATDDDGTQANAAERATLDQEERAEVEHCLSKIAKHVRVSGMHTTEYFENYRRHHASVVSRPGCVTMPQYVRGIDALGVPLSTEQRELLYKAFVASTNRNEFNYVKFASAIDARIASHRAQTMKVQPGRMATFGSTASTQRSMTSRRHGSVYYDRAGRVRPLRPCSAPCTRRPQPCRGRAAPPPPHVHMIGVAG